MPHIPDATDAQLETVKPALDLARAAMGFEPNSLKIMARSPAMLNGFLALSGAILGPDNTLDPGLRQMMAHITSAAAGCRYCQAHTAHGAEHRGVDLEKIEAIWSFETSPLFSDAERAALNFAQAAGRVPNEVTEAHYNALRAHFSDDDIVEMVGVISLFGFLNRWNDTLGTALEDSPLAFAEAHLAQTGWTPGHHR
ncbi:MAG: peroxidase-related enzyme [Pseudomonadota bacterium]